MNRQTKQKPITMSVYQLKMGKIIKLCKHKPIDECLIAILEEASKWRIINDKKRPNKVGKKT